MTYFIIGIIILILGYITYGKIVDKHFGADDSIETPATRLQDGIDFMPMTWNIITRTAAPRRCQAFCARLMRKEC